MPSQSKGVFSDVGVADSALRLGMRWFICSLMVFLVASVIAITVVRAQVKEWPALPAIPSALWLSTAVLLLSTITLYMLKKTWSSMWYWISMVSIIAFLGLQIYASIQWHDSLTIAIQSKEVVAISQMSLYVLIFLHGLHVIGGIIPLGLIATQQGYEKRRQCIPHILRYWDFICCIWIFFFIVLLLLR
ncbi:MAG: hypothetical protein HOC93_03350 [Phycisphaerae bacterium]|jgi:cytochrome c oxidase subunit III|nr:hypothetical protein [Phycisphaerae bacterium]